MVYEALGRNTQRTDTFGDVTKTEYDRTGNAIKQIDAKNKNTLIAFDARGRRKSTTDRIGAVTTFAYTALGQLLSLTDAENRTTSYTYDSRGSKLTEQYPDHVANAAIGTPGCGIVTFVYDQAGRVLRKQDQAGDTCTYNYDLAGRITSRNYRTAANSPSGAIADTDVFTFNRAGHMLTAVSGRYTNTITYTYDPTGRKATEALTVSNVTYTIGQAYNARNELTTITYPNNTTSTRSYHATGMLDQLGLDGLTVSTRSYDAGRRQTTDVLSNGITETRAYRNDNLLTAINYSNTSLGDMAYTWDANKNKTSESITGVMSGYGFTTAGTTYDNENRLTGFARAASSGPAMLSQSWNLTADGDWASVTTNGTAQGRTHGPAHELLTADGQTVATDVKGNITTLPANLRPEGATTAMNLNWDFDNKLRSADIDANGTADVNFQYDAFGRRVARTGTGGSVVFAQMGQQTIADYPVGGTAANPIFRYVYAGQIDELVVRKGPTITSTAHFYHRNHQYSVTAITTSTGTIAERYAYTAYGQPTILNANGAAVTPQISGQTNRYAYAGRESDETLGLFHFRSRWASPAAGRFLGTILGSDDSRHWHPFNPNNPNENNYWLPDNRNTRCNFLVQACPSRVPPYHPGNSPQTFNDIESYKLLEYDDPNLNETIVQYIDQMKCCEIAFFGHQGGDKNPGGCAFHDEHGNVVKLLPNPEREQRIKEALLKNKCDDCGIILATCGATDPAFRDPTRQNIANSTGCQVLGTNQLVYPHSCTFTPGPKVPTGGGPNDPRACNLWPFLRYLPNEPLSMNYPSR